MAKSFEIRTSNVRVEIESVTVNEVNGQVDIQFKARDPRIANFQISLAQYNAQFGYKNMTLLPSVTRDTITVVDKNTNIPAKGENKSYVLVWDAGADIDLIDHEIVTFKIQGKDSDGVEDEVSIYGEEVEVNLRPIISRFTIPLEFLKDTTPILAFEVPPAVKPCNLHFTLVISQSEDLSNPVVSLSSLHDRTGWAFEIAGVYYQMLAIGCPDISALLPHKSRCKHELQAPLDPGVYYWGILSIHANKKIPSSEMHEIPTDYPFYSVNLGFDVDAYGLTIDQLDINPEDLEQPEIY